MRLHHFCSTCLGQCLLYLSVASCPRFGRCGLRTTLQWVHLNNICTITGYVNREEPHARISRGVWSRFVQTLHSAA
ncbi:hypothetical protein J3E68DRAFT_238236 [Trichoderma sp. SZMC 28012]